VRESQNAGRQRKIEIEFILPLRVASLSAVCLMRVAWRWLAALFSCAADTLYVSCVWHVHDAVVPRDVYRLKHKETQSLLDIIIRPKPLR
jgi:hypothetical protein